MAIHSLKTPTERETVVSYLNWYPKFQKWCGVLEIIASPSAPRDCNSQRQMRVALEIFDETKKRFKKLQTKGAKRPNKKGSK